MVTHLKNLDIAIYLRKSRKDIETEREAALRGEEYDTLTKHRKELLAYARKNEHNIVDIFEEVVSGEYIAERPEMQALLQKVKDLNYDGILVMDLDRFGRGDKMDQGRIERTFKESQTLILTPQETLDLNEESGEFTVEVKTFLARMEYKQIKKRLQGGRRRGTTSGRDQSTKPPYGYRKDDSLRLVIHEEEAKIVRMIFQWCVDVGMGRSAIAQRLMDLEILSPTGLPQWQHVTIGRILKNPKYKGDQVFGRTKWSKNEDGTYSYTKVHDIEQMAYLEGAHEPIVDPDLWEKAQEALSRRREAPVKKNHDILNPFAGILKCKKCGKAMLANKPTNRPNKYLSCYTTRCDTKMIALYKVEEVFLRQLETIFDHLRATAKKRRSQPDDAALDLAKKKVLRIKEDIKKTNLRKTNLHDLLEDGTYDKDTFLERSRLLQEQLKQLDNELEAAEKQVELEAGRLNQALKVLPMIKKALTEYKSAGSIKEQNALLKEIVREIKYRRETDWTGQYQFEIEIHLYD
ncbi:recombinase family protein [Brevibacillus brevis X23]|nr:recombinase family protein [Brevibacillus brevis X23]